jgi:two-component system OmpR family response regulator
MAALLKRALREDGHTVDVALNGDDALWHASEFTYDAVVVDVMLPGPDSVQLCKRLRGRDRRTPVLMLTRREHDSDRVRGLDAGADAFLVEPFSFDDFTAQLSAMTRRRAARRAEVVKVGELVVSPATGQAWRGETEVILTPRELALLRLFMANAWQPLDRDYIFERIWDCTSRASSNLVDQYVLYLRRQIDRPFGVRQIETVRGLGYRLREHPVAIR